MRKFFAGAIVLTLVLISLFVFGCSSSDTTENQQNATGQESSSTGYRSVSAEDLNNMMNTNKNLIVVDVREKDEYQQGHINGTLLIPMSEFESRINELPKDKTIAVVCATGARSSQVANFLVQSGYTDVYNLEGGLSSWPYDLTK